MTFQPGDQVVTATKQATPGVVLEVDADERRPDAYRHALVAFEAVNVPPLWMRFTSIRKAGTA